MRPSSNVRHARPGHRRCRHEIRRRLTRASTGRPFAAQRVSPCQNISAFLGTPMTLRRFTFGWLIVGATVIAELSSTPAAQTSLLPAASLRVNAGWTNQTWPADFNEDG